ncbi:MAG: hypothetical protein ACLSG5_15375 [Oscillospiraceae bacterium]
MKIRNIVSAAAACAVAAAALVIPTSAEESYVAGITWQSSSYYFRNTIAQSELLYWDNDLGEAAPLEGTTGANITGDGEYTVTSMALMTAAGTYSSSRAISTSTLRLT